jgi:hypothetical protein
VKQAGIDGDFTYSQRNELVIDDDGRMYQHKVLRINFTTYDMRRSQDRVNYKSQPDVMVLSSEGDEHPFTYARVIGIYHANVRHPILGQHSTRMDFLHVRWFQVDASYKAGWLHRRLHRVAFIPEDDSAFGFLDPREVIRAVHLIPAFSGGSTDEYMPPSAIARVTKSWSGGYKLAKDDDWSYFYVNW